MNTLHIIGNLTANPKSRVVNTANGTSTVCDFTVATNRYVKGKKVAEYFRVTLWERAADNAMKYLTKGRKVAVTGPVEGRQEGFRQAAEPIIKCCYAGIILALHDEFGFGENRAFRAIKAVDEKIIWALNHSELCDEVLAKTGLELLLDEPFERVQKIEK
jgi:hypothetical protein